MTNEQNPNITERAIPEDQLAFEIDLQEGFKAEFPDQAPVMDEALDDLKRFAGFNIPKYQVSAEDEYRATTDGMVDDMGFLATNGESPKFLFIMLQVPVHYSEEQIAAMNSEEQNIAQYQNSGIHIPNEPSLATTKLIKGLYDLTGASPVHADRGVTVLKGEYQGCEIYFEELRSRYGNIDVLSLRLLNPRLGKQTENLLTTEQVKEFIGLSGLTSSQSMKLINRGDVRRDNYVSAAHALSQTAKIVDPT